MSMLPDFFCTRYAVEDTFSATATQVEAMDTGEYQRLYDRYVAAFGELLLAMPHGSASDPAAIRRLVRTCTLPNLVTATFASD